MSEPEGVWGPDSMKTLGHVWKRSRKSIYVHLSSDRQLLSNQKLCTIANWIREFLLSSWSSGMLHKQNGRLLSIFFLHFLFLSTYCQCQVLKDLCPKAVFSVICREAIRQIKCWTSGSFLLKILFSYRIHLFFWQIDLNFQMHLYRIPNSLHTVRLLILETKIKMLSVGYLLFEACSVQE